jgi:hypothetical protein
MNAAVDSVSGDLQPIERRTDVAPLEESTVLLQVIARAAQDTTIDIDRMERLIGIQQMLAAKKSERDFTEALARFQTNAPIITKDKRVYFKGKNGGATTDYKHATLGNVSQAILSVLGPERISVSWVTEQRDARIYVTCVLKHAGGHETRTQLNGAPDATGNKNAVQQVVSTITMLQRYTLLAATGMATHDQDDDGGGGGDDTGGGDPAGGGSDSGPETYSQEKFDANFAKWSHLITSGKKTTAEVIGTVEAVAPLTEAQKKRLNDLKQGTKPQ